LTPTTLVDHDATSHHNVDRPAGGHRAMAATMARPDPRKRGQVSG
jgi:hypothetical protein